MFEIFDKLADSINAVNPETIKLINQKDKQIQDLERLIEAQREEIYLQRMDLANLNGQLSEKDNEILRLETIIQFFDAHN